MEAVISFEASVTTYQSPQCLIPEDLNFLPLTLLFGLQWKNKMIEIILHMDSSCQAPCVTVLSFSNLGHDVGGLSG